jgi:hypothetical protein
MYVKAGTAVTLRCLISNCLEEPAYVFWYHGDRRLLDDEDQIPGKFLARKCDLYTILPFFSVRKIVFSIIPGSDSNCFEQLKKSQTWEFSTSWTS